MTIVRMSEKQNIFRQKEFKFFWLNDDINQNFRQRDLEIEFGGKSSFLFHFVGFGDTIRMDKRKFFPNQSHLCIEAILSDINSVSFEIVARENFYLSRGIVQESDPGQVVCFVDYAYGSDITIVQMIEYYNGIRQRIPYVISTLTKFIAKLKEFNLIKSADQITVSGNIAAEKSKRCFFFTLNGIFSRILSWGSYVWHASQKS